jgi:hypothetical protein
MRIMLGRGMKLPTRGFQAGVPAVLKGWGPAVKELPVPMQALMRATRALCHRVGGVLDAAAPWWRQLFSWSRDGRQWWSAAKDLQFATVYWHPLYWSSEEREDSAA